MPFVNISKLEPGISSQIRSELIVRDLASSAIELVDNSIDAEATCIAIKLNPRTFKIQVVDNGVGIPKELLEVIGTRYFTSKWNNINSEGKTAYFGYRGECLASIKNSCSRLMIVSRPSDDDTTYCKVFDGSKTPTVDVAKYQRMARGTTITVDNFLGNVPVRQKRLVMSVEIQKIKRRIQAVALMRPSVYFTVRNDDKGTEILRIERTHSTFRTFAFLFPDTVKNRSSMIKVTSEVDDVQMKAMISKEPSNSRQLQFVYVNKRYISESAIRKIFNELLSNSSFWKGASGNVTHKVLRPAPLSKTRKNYIFILNICCSSSDYDIILQPDKRYVEFKNRTKIKTCLIKLVEQFLNQIMIIDRSITAKAEANYLFNKENVESDTFVPKRIFEKLNYAHTIFGLPVTRRPIGRNEFGSGASFQNEVLENEMSQIENYDINWIENDSFELRYQDDNLVDPNLKSISRGNEIRHPVSIECDSVLNEKRGKDDRIASGSRIKSECKASNIISICQRQINDGNRGILGHQDYGNASENIKLLDFTPGTCLISRPSEKPVLEAETMRFHLKKKRRLVPLLKVKSVNKDKMKFSRKKCLKNEFSNSSMTVSYYSTTYHRVRCSKRKWVKTNSNIHFYDIKKRYHLNRTNRFESDKTKPMKMYRLHKRETVAKKSAEKPEMELSLSQERHAVGYTPKTNSNPFSRTHWRKSCLRVENSEENDRNSYSKKLSKEGILKMDDFKFSPRIVTQFSNGNIVRSPYFDYCLSQKRCVESMQVPFSPRGNACQNTWGVKSVLATFNSHKRYIEMGKNKRSIFSSDDFIFMSQINQKRMLNCQNLRRRNEFRRTPTYVEWKQATTRPLDLCAENFSKDWVVDSMKNFDEMNNNMTLLRINSTPNSQMYGIFDADVKTFRGHKVDEHENVDPEVGCKTLIGSSDFKSKSEKCCCKCHEGEEENENVAKYDYYRRDTMSTVGDAFTKHMNAECVANFTEPCALVDNQFYPVCSVDTRNTFCRRPPCSTTSLIPSLFPNSLNSSCSYTTGTEENILESHIVLVSPSANTEGINGPVFVARNVADPDQLDDDKKLKWRNRLMNFDNVDNFTNEMLVEKMKLKMKSKFLMSVPVTEIPKGILAVPVAKSNTISLSKDEKEDLRNLIKPCNLKNHITLDDSGNSCLRIFPYFKKHEKDLGDAARNERDLEKENCSLVFSKLDLKSIKVSEKFFSQIDRKFLLAYVTMNETRDRILVAFDQHAVDERIRVERLLKDYVNDKSIWKSQSINPPIFLNVAWSDVSVIVDFEDVFRSKGLYFEFNKLNMESCRRSAICVVKVPTCLFNKASKENTTAGFHSCLKQLVESTIKELVESFAGLGPEQKTIPSTLRNVINIEACRGAVKFGDKLSSNVCIALLKNLSCCDMPYQCAHGRPLLAPLVNFAKLKHLEEQPLQRPFENLKNLLQRQSYFN